MKARQLFSVSGLILTGVFLLVSVAVISSVFPRLRLDLTQDDLYTLADGTREIVTELDRPVELLFFYSEEATADSPRLRSYGQRVQELLREMVIASNGSLSMEVIDPQPFSVDEEMANQYGVRPVPQESGGENVYFGVVARDPTTVEEAPDSGPVPGTQNREEEVYETIPLIRPDQERFLEYEFSRLITRIAEPEPTTVGLISSLPIDGGYDPARQQATQPWAIMDNIRHLYEVRRLGRDTSRIEDDIDILMVAHPQGLPAGTRYAIDQFVLGGGRALVFVDPNADIQSQQASNGGGGDTPQNFSSDLPELLPAWGVEYDPGQVVTDDERALFVNIGQQDRPVTHIGMLGLRPPDFADDMITSRLQVINLATAGALSAGGEADTQFEPLLQSTTQSTLMNSAYFRELNDPSRLRQEFSADPERYTVAARVSGAARTAFPDGPPAGADQETTDTDDASAQAPDSHISESREDISVIVAADTDLLADRMWARQQQAAGQRVTEAFASNADFVTNSLDYLSGSRELISIRGRGSYARPFTRVIELQRQADEQLRQEESNLLEQLEQTEQQIAALSQESDSSGNLTPEQQAEISRFMQQQAETQRQLREVRHQLNDDIESLGARLQLINTALVPTLVVIAGLIVGYLRRRRHR